MPPIHAGSHDHHSGQGQRDYNLAGCKSSTQLCSADLLQGQVWVRHLCCAPSLAGKLHGLQLYSDWQAHTAPTCRSRYHAFTCHAQGLLGSGEREASRQHAEHEQRMQLVLLQLAHDCSCDPACVAASHETVIGPSATLLPAVMAGSSFAVDRHATGPPPAPS